MNFGSFLMIVYNSYSGLGCLVSDFLHMNVYLRAGGLKTMMIERAKAKALERCSRGRQTMA